MQVFRPSSEILVRLHAFMHEEFDANQRSLHEEAFALKSNLERQTVSRNGLEHKVIGVDKGYSMLCSFLLYFCFSSALFCFSMIFPLTASYSQLTRC